MPPKRIVKRWESEASRVPSSETETATETEGDAPSPCCLGKVPAGPGFMSLTMATYGPVRA